MIKREEISSERKPRRKSKKIYQEPEDEFFEIKKEESEYDPLEFITKRGKGKSKKKL